MDSAVDIPITPGVAATVGEPCLSSLLPRGDIRAFRAFGLFGVKYFKHVELKVIVSQEIYFASPTDMNIFLLQCPYLYL